jgi:hypothetical protein
MENTKKSDKPSDSTLPKTNWRRPFEDSYVNYLRTVQDAWIALYRRVEEAWRERVRSIGEAIGESDAEERIEDANKRYMQAILAAWTGAEQQLRHCYQTYLGSLQKAWAGTDVKIVDIASLAMIGQSVMAAAAAACYAGADPQLAMVARLAAAQAQ